MKKSKKKYDLSKCILIHGGGWKKLENRKISDVQFNKKCDLDEIRKVLSTSPGCKVIDEHQDGGYITPVEAEDKFETFISRIRLDESRENTINLWIVSDNLVKGAA